MRKLYNVYCDESCHLEYDGINDMVLGAVWCPQNKKRKINTEIKDIKLKYGVQPSSELKWTKVAPVKADKCNLDECEECQGIKAWEEPYKANLRVHILLEEERYLVVLEKRERYCLLITAFYIEYNHSLQKKLKKYEEYMSRE